jgi:hypothetical protein
VLQPVDIVSEDGFETTPLQRPAYQSDASKKLGKGETFVHRPASRLT